ncbi:MAG: GTPase [Planctomycetota bacterium]|nr:GTPase [Planctomycetota bacterium]
MRFEVALDGEITFEHLHFDTCSFPLDGSDIPCRTLTFRSPRSYTGEDVAEIHLPGSQAICSALCDELALSGARAARPGEYTRRAFENGKLDINQAQGVLNLIHSHSESARRASLSALRGNFTLQVAKLRSDILDLLARLEANMDMSEQDIELISHDELKRDLVMLRGALIQMAASIRTEAAGYAKVVLTGPPNAGKSTIFNMLTGSSALVTSTARTTRDVLTALFEVNGFTARLVDTAGFAAEATGVDSDADERAKREVRSADVLIVVISSDTSLDDTYRAVNVDERPIVLVVNKTDLIEGDTSQKAAIEAISRRVSAHLDNPDIVYSCALEGMGKTELERAVADALWGIHGSGDLALSRIQHDALLDAVKECRNALTACRDELPEEVIALHIRAAVKALEILEGRHIDEEVLDRIFENFCIGK